jgi:hypothetical protein
MPTSVHIPPELLEQADKRANALGISRNKLIVRALEKELRQGTDWSPGFFERMREIDAETAEEFEKSMEVVKQSRLSKAPPTF